MAYDLKFYTSISLKKVSLLIEQECQVIQYRVIVEIANVSLPQWELK